MCPACGSRGGFLRARRSPTTIESAGTYAMSTFLKATFNRHKFQGLFLNTALGNFAGYVAGSLVTLVSTHRVLERRAVRNLFGVLPRKNIVVHVLPQWLEWLLALLVGFLVMEAVRYWINHRKYALLLSALWPTRGNAPVHPPARRRPRSAASLMVAPLQEHRPSERRRITSKRPQQCLQGPRADPRDFDEPRLSDQRIRSRFDYHAIASGAG